MTQTATWNYAKEGAGRLTHMVFSLLLVWMFAEFFIQAMVKEYGWDGLVITGGFLAVVLVGELALQFHTTARHVRSLGLVFGFGVFVPGAIMGGLMLFYIMAIYMSMFSVMSIAMYLKPLGLSRSGENLPLLKMDARTREIIALKTLAIGVAFGTGIFGIGHIAVLLFH